MAIDGLKLANGKAGDAYTLAVHITGNSTNVTLSPCLFAPTQAPNGALSIMAGSGKTLRAVTVSDNELVGYGENNVVLVRPNSGTVDGVTFSGNKIYHDVAGGPKQDDGIHLQTSSTDDWYRNIVIRDNEFYECTQKSFIIVEGKHENVSIYDNKFHGHVSVAALDIGQDVGAGASKNLRVYNNLFYDIAWMDVGTWVGYAVIWVFSQNQYAGSTPGIIANNTFVGTKAANERLIHVGNGAGDSSNIVIENNIFVGATTAIEVDPGQAVGTISNNLFHDNLTDLQNATDAAKKTGDPLFADEPGRVLTLTASSPAIDAGLALPSVVTTDHAGTRRPQGVTWDIGAYEHAATGPAVVPSPPGDLRVE